MRCKDPGNPFIAHSLFLKNTRTLIQNVFLNFREQYFEDGRILSSSSKVIKPFPQALPIKTEKWNTEREIKKYVERSHVP